MSRSRNKSKPKIDSMQVLQALLTLLQPRLPLALANTRITAEDLLEVLAYASVYQTGLETACQELYVALRAVVQTGVGTDTRCRRPWLSLRRLALLLGRAIQTLLGPPLLVQVRPVEGFS